MVESAQSNPPARVDWKAAWIWHEDDPQRKNTYVYFRKPLQLDRRPDDAVIHITADTEYMLWVNGLEVGRGPVLSDPRWQPYDTYDLAPFLRDGENVIAVLCYYYGEGMEDDSWRRFRTRDPLNMKRASHDSRPGLLCQAEMTTDGEQVCVVSDGSWRSLISQCWLCDVAKIDDQTYSEVYFAELEPGPWPQPGYDDRAWDGVKVLRGYSGGAPHARIFPWIMLEPRDLPHLAHRELLPASVSATGEVIEGDYEIGATALQMALEHILPSEFTAILRPECFVAGGLVEIEPFDQRTTYESFHGVRSATAILDMGALINGRVHLDLAGPSGGRIDIAYGQRLLENGKPEIYSSRICSADTYVMRTGRQRWTSFGWRHFRYVQLTFRDLYSPLTIHGIRAVADDYPADEIGTFECSDETLNWVWRAGVKTARLCTYDRYMDCANRERRQHSMGVMVLGTFTAFGDTAIVRRFFRAFMRGQTMYGFIPNASPSEYEHSPIIGGSSTLTSAIWKHYCLYADRELLAEAYEMMVRYLRLLESFRGADGLIGDQPMVVFQDDPEVDGSGKGKILVVNVCYALELEVAGWMAAELGNAEAALRYARQSSETRDAISEKFWDNKRGVFVDYISPEDSLCDHVSEHGNYTMMSRGYVSDERAARMVGFLRNPDASIGQVSPAYMPWALEGLFRYGYASDALRLVRERFGRFVRNGYDTLGELWNINGCRSCGGTWQQFGSRAVAHGEPTRVLYSLVLGVLGISPLTPGCEEIEIAPHVGDLEWAKGTVPTGKGVIGVEWRVADAVFTLNCDLPDGMRARVSLPFGGLRIEDIRVNGKKLEPSGAGIYVTGTARVEAPYPSG